jgi:hypothetical protein
MVARKFMNTPKQKPPMEGRLNRSIDCANYLLSQATGAPERVSAQDPVIIAAWIQAAATIFASNL